MQGKQFDELMDGKEAKWLLGGLKTEEVDTIDMESETPINEQIDKIIEEGHTKIPEDINEEIQSFIQMLRGLKVKDKEIRRRVKFKFNIQVF